MSVPASFLECATVNSPNTFNGAQTFSDAVACSSTLGVTGAATFSSTCAVTGAVTCSSTLGVTGAVTCDATLGVTGATTLNSTLGVTGAATLSSTLGVTGAATLSAASSVAINDATVNAVTRGLTLSHTTSATAQAGVGAGMLLRAESGAGTLRSAGAVDAIHTDVTDGAEVSALLLSAGIAGTPLEVARLVAVASAVNGFALTGSSTGQPVQISALGTDANITLAIVPKGTGSVTLAAGTGDNALGLSSAGILVDSGSDTGATPTVSRNSGIVRVQNTATTVTVTNTLCTADSKVFAQIRAATTNPVSVLTVVPGAGSFVITLSGDPGASHADLAFWMIQPDA